MDEETRRELAGLNREVAELRGEVKTLASLVTQRFDGVDGALEKASSFKNAVQFAAVVIVPILVALIGVVAVALQTGAIE